MQDISLERAIAALSEHIQSPENGIERVSLLSACGRILAEDIYAALDNPPFNRSPLDGYTFAAAATKGASTERPVVMEIVGEVCAGDYFSGNVPFGKALRIMTGAPIPEGCDAVVRQESVRAEGSKLYLDVPLRPFENYCYRGEDVKKGTLLASKGTKLNPACIAVLAGQGFRAIPVCRTPRILLASTGDELVTPGEERPKGKIYNSNLYLLASLLDEMRMTPKQMRNLPDDAALAAKLLREDAQGMDLILTTGGVSVGKKDIMHSVWKRMGASRIFWRILMKPGAPVLGYIFPDGRIGIALSGNPFAAFATFELLARPILQQMAGMREPKLLRKKAVLAAPFLKESPGRRFIRARYEDGYVVLPKQHASGALFSAVTCNAFIDIPAGSPKLESGREVEVVLF